MYNASLFLNKVLLIFLKICSFEDALVAVMLEICFFADALAEIGLQLVGPFDILNGSYRKQVEVQKYLCHWRYYYDPPEFLTVIRGDDKTQFHLGYYRYFCYQCFKNSQLYYVN